MNDHQEFLILLAVRDDLSPQEEQALREHLAGCAACHLAGEEYRRQDMALSALTADSAPVELEQRVRRQTRPRLPGIRWQWAGSAALAAVCVLAVGIAVLSGHRTATPANAYEILRRAAQAGSSAFPYTGSSDASYVSLPIYQAPARAVLYAGRHHVRVDWAVRDRTHFRVDIHTLSPALEQGTTTVVVNGRVITSYDTRTETAGRSTLPPLVYRAFAPYLLSYLKGGALPGFLQEPDPAQTIQRYLASIRQPNQPFCFPRYARLQIVRQEKLLNRTVDVVDFGPLVSHDVISGCSFQHPGPCVHHRQSFGWARVWVDRDHPFIVRYEQHGMPRDPHSLETASAQLRYSVTALHFGQDPSVAELAGYRPPVPVVSTGQWTVLSSGMSSGPQTAPAPFLTPSAPPGVGGRPFVSEGTDQRLDGSLQRTTAVDVVFDQGTHITTYTSNHRPFGLYASGPYLLVQERIQVHGLPQPLLAGQVTAARRCTIHSGAYTDGQRWASFQHGTVAVLVSTDSVSDHQLVRYVIHDVCP